MTDLYADENMPYTAEMGVVYIVRYPRPAEIKWEDGYSLYVEVDNSGMISIQPHSSWMGKNFKDMPWEEHMEIYSFLIEWELAEWKRIGPEDSELFATERFDENARWES